MTVNEIIIELNESNSTNHKISVLKKNKDNELLKTVLQMTYDKVKYTYGVSLNQIQKFKSEPNIGPVSLEYALAFLRDELSTRNITGHKALQSCSNILDNLSPENFDLVAKIINRDLRVNIGRTQLNKVWKGLITQPAYCRCSVYNEKTAKKIKFPAIVQLKSDGTYREIAVNGPETAVRSRSGEEYHYPIHEAQFSKYKDGVYTGEMTIRLNSDNVEKLKRLSKYPEEIHELYEQGVTVLPRKLGNGILNSDNVPHEHVVFDVWDYITHEEYQQALLKDKKNPCKTPYKERFQELMNIIHESENIKIIPWEFVNNVREAFEYTSNWMNKGYEGAILKDLEMPFKHGTSDKQLKMKLVIEVEVRVSGWKPGKPGTKREGKIGSIQFQNDEGTIKGYCSGFSDEDLDRFTDDFSIIDEKIITVECNDISKSAKNDYYALSHPRYIEVRTDKSETDSLEKVFEIREMALNFK